jgi:hypothetical protein
MKHNKPRKIAKKSSAAIMMPIRAEVGRCFLAAVGVGFVELEAGVNNIVLVVP